MSNIKNISIGVSGLNPEEQYSFTFGNRGGNWPVKVSPLSGQFYVINENTPYDVKTYVYFPPATGYCPPSDPNVFYNVPNTDMSVPGLDVGAESLYSVLGLNITEVSSNKVVFSYPCIVECDDCVPKLGISPTDVSLDEGTGNSTNFTSTVVGLIPNQLYFYNITGVSSNWPIKVMPASGYIQSSSTEHIIQSLVSFCPTIDGCSDNPSFDHSITENCENNQEKYAVLEISVECVGDNQYQTPTKARVTVVCNNCIKKPYAIIPNLLELNSNSKNKTVFNADIDNLVPGSRYSYKFDAVDSNWPVAVYPISGILSPSSKNVSMPIKMMFCTSTGICPSSNNDIIPYAVDSACLDKTMRMKLNINQLDCDNPISFSSNELTAICDNCIPKPVAQLPSTSITLNSNTKNKTAFSANMAGLTPGATYSYRFESVDSNWPIAIYPVSGVFSSISDSLALPIRLTFCSSTGICPPSNNDIMSYSLDSACLEKAARIRLNVIQTNCNDTVSFYSNELAVICDNCLPAPRASLTPTSIALTSTTNNKTSFVANMSDLTPGATYSYKFDTIDSNWPVAVYPISGVISPVSSTVSMPVSLTFCASTGMCPPSNNDVMTYSLDTACLDKAIRMKLNVTQTNCNDTVSFSSNELMVTCDNCISKPKVVLPVSPTTLSNENNSLNILANIENLIEGRSYKYTFKGVDGNWPVSLYPVSGTLIASSTTESVDSRLIFCRATGLCANDPRTLSYSSDSSCLYSFSDRDLYSRLRLEVEPLDCDNTKYISNDMVVMCDNCVPRASVTNSTSEHTLSGAGNNKYQLSTSFNKLTPGETYKYNINCLDGNWPAVVSKQSGEFLAVSENKSIKTDISFCFPSGACAIDDRDVYKNYRSNAEYKNSPTKFLNLNVSITPKNCLTTTSTSEEFVLTCNNCLPNTNLNAVISGSPVITLPLGCCSGTKLFAVNINGGIPNELHTYTITSSSPQIVFSPSSGNIIFDNTGTESIISLMTTSLSNREQGIAEFKVVNTISNIESNSFSVIRCGPECN